MAGVADLMACAASMSSMLGRPSGPCGTVRHPDVGEHRRRAQPFDGIEQLRSGPDGGRHDNVAGILQQPPRALPHQVAVVGHDDPQRLRHLPALGRLSRRVRIPRTPPDGFLVPGDRDVHANRRAEFGTAVIVSEPPTVSRRSDRLVSPSPRGWSRSKPHPSSRITSPSLPCCLAQRHLDLAGPGMLDHVRQCLGQHVPGGHLDVLGESHAAQPWVGADRHRQCQPAGLSLDCLQQPAVGQHRRMDRVGDLPDVVQRSGQIALHVGQPAAAAGSPRSSCWRTSAALADSATICCWTPSCRTRWNPQAIGVLARHHAIAGRRQFGRLVPDLLDALGEFRVKVKVVHAHRGLGGEIRQQPAVLGQQRAVGTRAALDAAQGGAVIFDRHRRGPVSPAGACRP